MTHGASYQAQGPHPHDERPRVSFSGIELLHLAGSVGMLTLAFAFVLGDQTFPDLLVPSPLLLLAAFLAVASGFVLHELAHKIVATRMGHWAEFRAWFAGLGISLAFAAGLGLLFAAPGAVLIQGRVSVRQNGIISLVGPMTNLLIAVATYPFSVSLNLEQDTTAKVFGVVSFVNALLALFNLLPVGILDGRKVWWWSKTAYLAAAAAALGFFAFLLVQGGVPAL